MDGILSYVKAVEGIWLGGLEEGSDACVSVRWGGAFGMGELFSVVHNIVMCCLLLLFFVYAHGLLTHHMRQLS